jgi:hypothetical protein
MALASRLLPAAGEWRATATDERLQRVGVHHDSATETHSDSGREYAFSHHFVESVTIAIQAAGGKINLPQCGTIRWKHTDIMQL